VSLLDRNSARLIVTSIGLIGILLFALPTVAIFIKPIDGEQFSQLYMLGPNYTFDNMPFNIVEGAKSLVYLGVGNELGYSSYYTVYVKIGGQNDSLPNIGQHKPSTLPPLYTSNFFLQNGQEWQSPLTIQVNKLSFSKDACVLSSIELNGFNYEINKMSFFNSQKNGYFYNLIVELWILNSTTHTLEYNDRFVSLMLNMTA
jgi:uncharacterized membrane protein